MAASVIQISPSVSSVDQATAVINTVLPAPSSEGNSILTFAAGWNLNETTGVVGAASDAQNNIYRKFGVASNRSTHLYVENFFARGADSGAQTIAHHMLLNNGKNRVSAFSVEMSGMVVGSGSPVLYVPETAGSGATSMTITTPSTTTKNLIVFGVLGFLWEDTPKVVTLPDGYTLLRAIVDTSGNKTGLYVVYKNVIDGGPQTITWNFNAQNQGVVGSLVAYEVSATSWQFRAPLNQLVSSYNNFKYTVYKKAPSGSNRIFGDTVLENSVPDIGESVVVDSKLEFRIDVPTDVEIDPAQVYVANISGLNNGVTGTNHKTDLQLVAVSHGGSSVPSDAAWRLTANGSELRLANNSVVKLRGLNVQGVIPYDVDTQDGLGSGGTGIDAVSQYLASSTHLDALRDRFGSSFNCVRVGISPHTVDGTAPLQTARLSNLAERCAARGIWLIVVPTGDGSTTSDLSTRTSNDGNQDESNAAAITAQVQAVHDDIVEWASGYQNIIIQLLDKPRTQTANTWKTQNATWIANLRGQDWVGPIIIEGYGNGRTLNTTSVAELLAIDSNLVFVGRAFSNLDHDAAVFPTFAAVSAPKGLINISNYLITPVDASYPGPVTWLNTLITNWTQNSAILLGGPALTTSNAVWGNILNGQTAYQVVTGNQPPILNTWGEALLGAIKGSPVNADITVLLDETFDSDVGPFSNYQTISSIVGGYIRVANSGNAYGNSYVQLSTRINYRYRITWDGRQGTSTGAPSLHVGTQASWNRYGQSVRVSPFDFTAADTNVMISMNVESQVAGHYNEYGTIRVEEMPPVTTPAPGPAPAPTPGGAGGLYMSSSQVEDVILNMTLPGEASQMEDGHTLRNSHANGAAQNRITSIDGLIAATVGQGHNGYFVQNIASPVMWLLVYAIAGTQANNTAIAARRMFCQTLLDDGNWYWTFRDAGCWGKRVYHGQDEAGSAGAGHIKRGDAVLVRPDGGHGFELWPSNWTGANVVNFYGAVNKDHHTRMKSQVMGVQVRRDLIDPNGVDDRSVSRYACQLGVDYYANPYPGNRYINDSGGKSNSLGAGFPYGVADGSWRRWDIRDENDWTWIYLVLADPAWGYENDLGPPFAYGYNNGKNPYVKAAGGYAITLAQLRANPPLNPDYY